jgi:hypothetical protein
MSTQMSTEQHSGTSANQPTDNLRPKSAREPIKEPGVLRRLGSGAKGGRGGIPDAMLN